MAPPTEPRVAVRSTAVHRPCFQSWPCLSGWAARGATRSDLVLLGLFRVGCDLILWHVLILRLCKW